MYWRIKSDDVSRDVDRVRRVYSAVSQDLPTARYRFGYECHQRPRFNNLCQGAESLLLS